MGAEKITFRDPAKLVDTMKKYIKQVVVLYVFNSPTDSVRPVAVVPTLDVRGPPWYPACVSAVLLTFAFSSCSGRGPTTAETAGTGSFSAAAFS